jgi:hypothetical protein
MTDDQGATYIEVLMLQHLDSRERALRIGHSMLTPLTASDGNAAPQLERLRFWSALIAFLLGVAEHRCGADGREAIVQTMRNVPASEHLAGILGPLQ